MKPVVGLLRQLSIRMIVYLDDMLIIAQSGDIALLHASTALDLLQRLGFTLNYLKSVLVPSPRMEFLGFMVESLTVSLALPRAKIRKVRKESQALLNSSLVTVRQLLSEVTGTSYLNHSRSLSRAPPLPPLAKREKQGFSTFSNLRLYYSPFPSGQRGIGLVERLP